MKALKKPEIWKSEKFGIHRYYRMVVRMKENGINENQFGVFKVENGYVYSEIYCQLDSIDDRGDYWYIGYTPVGKSKMHCGRWGYTRLYKNFVPEWCTIELKEVEWADWPV